MPSNIMVDSDKTWATPLWVASASEYKKWWPTGMQETFTPEIISNQIAVKEQRMYKDPNQKGFFIAKRGYLPELNIYCPQLVIWIVQPRLPVAEYRSVLKGLFTEWLTDEVTRKEHEYGFGEMPVTMPDRSKDYLDDWGINVSEYDGLGAVKWRRYWFKMADAIGKLP